MNKRLFKNIKNKTLKKCSMNPLTGYSLDGYCKTNDFDNWNCNPFINTPTADPYNKKRVINISSNNSYNLMKYNAVIMLKEF